MVTLLQLTEIDSEEGEIEDDTFLEELFNTSMESLDTSEDSPDELTQSLHKSLVERLQSHSLLQNNRKREIL